jgi:hypothetical protein
MDAESDRAGVADRVSIEQTDGAETENPEHTKQQQIEQRSPRRTLVLVGRPDSTSRLPAPKDSSCDIEPQVLNL